MLMKVCKRCGRELPLDNFRDYYNGSGKKYSFCKTCESIEQRRKYLVGKEALSEYEQQELSKICALYERHIAAGRPVPGRRVNTGRVEAMVDELLHDGN